MRLTTNTPQLLRRLGFFRSPASSAFGVVLGAVLWSIAGGCQPGAEQDDRVFRYNESAGITSLDPAHARSLEPMWLVDQIFDGLVELDDALRIQPLLATHWEVADSGRTYTFYLREGVRFHAHPEVPGWGEGRELVASDVVFSLNRLRDPAVASSGGWILEALDTNAAGRGIEAPDGSRVVFHLKEAFPPFLGLLTTPYASVVAPEVVAHFGADFRRQPVGTGPFRLAWWVEDVACVLHRHPGYWERDEAGRPLPRLEAVHVDFAQDAGAEFLGLLQGRYDFVSGLHSAYLEEALDAEGGLRAGLQDRIRMEQTPFLKTDYIGIQLDPHYPVSQGSPLQDVRVRQALSLAIDRVAIARHLRRGAVVATDHFTPPGLPGAAPRGVPARDEARARALLAEAGFPGGAGLPPWTLLTTTESLDLCAALQHQWEALGLDIRVEVVAPATHREQVARGEALLFRKSWLADHPDAENFLSLFLTTNFAPGGPNYTHYSRPTFDALYRSAMKAPSDALRYEAYAAMDSLIAADLPVIPLFHDQVTHFLSHAVQGWSINPVNRLDLRRVYKDSAP
jgi:peptide/nickel transport system substrate-binding protein